MPPATADITLPMFPPIHMANMLGKPACAADGADTPPIHGAISDLSPACAPGGLDAPPIHEARRPL
ncbi:MAG: hypothetical protein ABUK15_07350 [Anaerolineales bacterium]